MPLPDRLTPRWRHRLFIAYVVAMVLVFVIPTPDTGLEVRSIDKAVHFLLFFGFAGMFYLDRRAGPGRIFLLSAAFAAGIELVQWVLPFREAELPDFIAGAAGAALAAGILLLYRASIASGSRG
jgi:VanZ family protein